MAKIIKTSAKNVSKNNSILERLMNKFPKGDGAILFDKTNYILMAVGIILIAIGFVLMAGKANPDPNIFDAEKIYSTQRITVAPIVILLGFVVEIVAIMKKPSKQA